MNTKASLLSSCRQLLLSLLLILSFNLDYEALTLLLLMACLVEVRKGLSQAFQMKEKVKEQLENKLFSRQFYPMPSLHEEADIRRLRRALRWIQPIRFKLQR